jgi:hypothetical protein
MAYAAMRTKSASGKLERFGFRCQHGSAHLARTMMLAELSQLLDYVPVSAAASDYTRAIEEDNCLGKRSGRTRTLTKRHLVELYSLDPDTTVFRVLRYFWQRDLEGRPLLACLCACARDPLLRSSAPFVLQFTEGQAFSREALESHLDNKNPGRFSRATLKSAAQNVASSWTQAGHLTGRVKKIRSRAVATSASTAYALLLGFLTGTRGESLLRTDYAKVLDCSFEKIVEYAEIASRKGWIVFKRVGNVVEVLFPALLTEEEKEWIRE